MSSLEALKATWPSTYLMLVGHVTLATFVFRTKASKRLLEAGISSKISEAERFTTLAYVISSGIILALSYSTLRVIFGADDPFDIRVLPMYYQWLGRIVLTPVSIMTNLCVLRFLTKATEKSKRKHLLGVSASPEKQLFLVNLLFAAFYV